jgi:hypothetical protein
MKFIGLILGLLFLISCTFDTDSEINKEMPIQVNSKTFGWSASGRVGAGDSSGTINQANGVSLQANFKEKGLAGDFTAQFTIGAPSRDLLLGERQRAVAEIIWSVEGNDVRRLVSCTNGLSVSGTAEAVKITIRDESENQTTPLFDYPVSIQIAPGTRPSTNQPPYYEVSGYTEVNNGVAEITLVPENAGVISLYVAVATDDGVPLEPGDITVEMRSGKTAGTGTLLKSFDPVLNNGFVPISPGCQRIEITMHATATATSAFITPVWGIDG